MGGRLGPNSRARHRVSGEVGVVVGELSADLVEVSFPAGVLTVHRDDIEPDPAQPDERLLARSFGQSTAYGLRLQAEYLRHAYRFDPRAGLSNARIEPKHHQVYAARRVVEKLRPRMILADEVGLGKTIQAGLILKELRARGLVDRVLIVVPASLQFQWRSELRSKFNEEFELFDGPTIRHYGRGGDNPWLRADNIICSLPLAARDANAAALAEAPWDLVIFDEAHRVRRHRQGPRRIQTTKAYALADELKELTFGMLMLTATPMQLHPYELYSLIELVEPGLFKTYETYERRRKSLPRLNTAMRHLQTWSSLSPDERVSAEETVRSALRKRNLELSTHELRQQAMETLVEKHPLAGTLIRNRKSQIGGFMGRNAQKVTVKLSAEEFALYEDVTEYIRSSYNRAQAEKRYAIGFLMVLYQQMLASSSHAIRHSFLKRIAKLRDQLAGTMGTGRSRLAKADLEELRDAPEASETVEELESETWEGDQIRAELLELESLVERLGKVRDTKALKLVEGVKAIDSASPGEKVLVFTRYMATQEFLATALRRNGFEVATFNGSMNLDQKEAQVRRFRTDAQVMVTTEAGGEGRNFQFAHHMFNYDLPWNPMRVEQRIGRLDRIGQRHVVQVFNIACLGTIEERILTVLADRIRLFEESVGSLDPILGEVEADIEKLVMADPEDLDERFERYGENLRSSVEEARTTERVLADFILDHASLRKDVANELLERAPMAVFSDLRGFVASCLDYFGGRLSEHTDGGDVISLSSRLMSRIGRAAESANRGVFDPQLALEREDLDFLAFGHPLVDAIAELPRGESQSVCGVRCLDTASGPGVEVVYTIEASGLVRRGDFIRHIVGPDLQVSSEVVTSIPPIGGEVSRPPDLPWIDDAVRASKERYLEEFAEFRTGVLADHNDAKKDERARAKRIFEYQGERLRRIIAEEQAWIDEKEESGTEADRRVMPARRGKLDKNRERLSRLEADYQRELIEIKEQEPHIVGRPVVAGVVVPP